MENGGERYVYLTPTKTAQPGIYDPLSEYQRLILDAIDIGRLESQKKLRRRHKRQFRYLRLSMACLDL